MSHAAVRHGSAPTTGIAHTLAAVATANKTFRRSSRVLVPAACCGSFCLRESSIPVHPSSMWSLHRPLRRPRAAARASAPHVPEALRNPSATPPSNASEITHNTAVEDASHDCKSLYRVMNASLAKTARERAWHFRRAPTRHASLPWRAVPSEQDVHPGHGGMEISYTLQYAQSTLRYHGFLPICGHPSLA